MMKKTVLILTCAALIMAGTATNARRTRSFVTNSVGMKFVKLPAGEYYITSRHYRTKKLIKWYKVRVSKSFLMGTTEVTQGQWKKVMGRLPHIYKSYRGANKPVANVSFKDVQKFIRKLNEREPNATYRLPYYFEWEYVAKNSHRSFFYWGTNEMNGRYAVYNKNSGDKPWRVASKRPERHGIYDLWGNVWEWTLTRHTTVGSRYSGVRGRKDCENTDPFYCYPAGHVTTDPKGRSDGRLYRIAGYAYDITEHSCTGASPRAYDPDYKYYTLGFRLVRVLKGGEEPPVTPGPNKPNIPNPKKPVKINPALNRPMLQAAFTGKTSRVRSLLSRGADPNARHSGWTALLYAAYYGHKGVVQALIDYGANASIKLGGWDALSLARYRRHAQIQRMLEAYTGRRAIRKRGLRRPRRPRRPRGR